MKLSADDTPSRGTQLVAMSDDPTDVRGTRTDVSVLVVEPVLPDAISVASALSQYPFQVTLAETFVKAKERIGSRAPDVLITHTQMPDMPFYGGGGGMAHRLGMRPSCVLDLHNGGCAAFVLALQVAKQLLSSGELKTALIAIAQNAGGQVFDQPTVRRKPQASVPGDGAAVALVTLSDRSPILDVETRTYGQYAGDMTIAVDPPRKWWQPGPGELHIGFTESKITKVLARGNREVPEVVLAVCDRIGMQPKDLDLLITNQPNRVFLRNWREALELPNERHLDTFDDYGNLFAAGIPINLDRAITDGQLKAQILSYSRAQGLFAGIDLTGGVLKPDTSENREFYGRNYTAREILKDRKVNPPASAGAFLAALKTTVPARTQQQ